MLAKPCTAAATATWSSTTFDDCPIEQPRFTQRSFSFSLSSTAKQIRNWPRSTSTAGGMRDRSASVDTDLGFCESSSSFEVEWFDEDAVQSNANSQDALASETQAAEHGCNANETRSPVVCDAKSFILRKLAKSLYTKKVESEQLSKVDLLLPQGLLECIAKRILFAAANEPAGLRGCALNISLQLSDVQGCASVIELGTVQFCSRIISTFELKLRLHEEPNPGAALWWKIKMFEMGLLSKRPLPLSDDVTIEKIALYV